MIEPVKPPNAATVLPCQWTAEESFEVSLRQVPAVPAATPDSAFLIKPGPPARPVPVTPM